jgi:hypothetical protein
MKLIEFADKYNLKVKKMEGESVIPGRAPQGTLIAARFPGMVRLRLTMDLV